MSKEYEWVNARIESTFLGFEDHGILTFSLGLEFAHCHQGFGGCGLSSTNNGVTTVVPQTGYIIKDILETVGVDRWERLKGQLVRVGTAKTGTYLRAIRHIIDDERTLDLTDIKWDEPTSKEAD